MAGTGRMVGTAAVTCPACGAVLDVPIYGETQPGLHVAGTIPPLVIQITPDHDALHQHVLDCPGDDGPDPGEEAPIVEVA
jgi:hypothetical protein